MKSGYNPNSFDSDDSINIRAEIEKYLIYWKWFIVGIVLTLALAFLYLRYSTPQYSAKAVILIKENNKSGISAEMKTFEDLGILGGSQNNIDNEIEIINSRKIVGETIKKLNLNVSYYSSSRIKETEIYKESPLRFSFYDDDLISNKDTTFFVSLKKNNLLELSSQDNSNVESYKLNEVINSNLGKFKVTLLNKDYVNGFPKKIRVRIQTIDDLIDVYQKKINIVPVNKNSSVLVLTINDAVRLKAVQFLDSLVSSYNKDAIFDKNLVSQKTKTFIDERLRLVKEDFDNVNLELKNFKTTNEVTNIETESELILKSIDDVRSKIIEANIQLSLVSSLYKELLDNSKGNNLLPPNLGLEDITIANSIIEYNKLIQTKVRLMRTAGKENPTIININDQINGIKSSLIKSLENSKKGIELTLKQLYVEDNKIKSKISGVPLQELELGKIKLKQEIISRLYSYLLNKKEETDISLAVTVSNAKIIDRAYSSFLPVSPKKKVIYIVAFLLGILIPFIIIYLKYLFDTKVHNKADIEESLSIPFLGDVPKSDDKSKIVIGADARSSTAEAFRLIRTNLDFMLANIKGKSKTIFVTSTTSGEGKSFISINVAASLALSGKKVLLMGMDLRAPKVTEYLGLPDRKGVTNYITDDDLDLENLIFNIDDIKNLDIISSGVVPPNPAELLMTKRTENLFTIIKEEYDYVVVDTAPVNLVTDTLLISKYADMFIYIARANYLDKRLLAVPQTLYNEKRLPNMAMVLNDTDPKRSYGYGYGGYGYGYVVEEKPWYKKILNR